MDHDFKDEEDLEIVVVNMQIEFYLKGREDPMQCYMSVGCPKSIFEIHGVMAGIWALMDEATGDLIGDMDSKGMPYLTITDKRMNRYVLKIDEIQSISVLTPDKEIVEKALEENNEDE